MRLKATLETLDYLENKLASLEDCVQVTATSHGKASYIGLVGYRSYSIRRILIQLRKLKGVWFDLNTVMKRLMIDGPLGDIKPEKVSALMFDLRSEGVLEAMTGVKPMLYWWVGPVGTNLVEKRREALRKEIANVKLVLEREQSQPPAIIFNGYGALRFGGKPGSIQNFILEFLKAHDDSPFDCNELMRWIKTTRGDRPVNVKHLWATMSRLTQQGYLEVAVNQRPKKYRLKNNVWSDARHKEAPPEL